MKIFLLSTKQSYIYKVKPLLSIFLLLFVTVSFGQDDERINIQGKIIVPKGEEAEGIHIYNVTSERGTVTDTSGVFSIAVMEQDRLQITSIQYKSFTVVVSKKALDENLIKIYLNPFINTLDEVLLSSHNLTGDLERDAQNIGVIAVPEIELSFDADADFAPDRFSRIEGNVAEEALGYGRMQNGLNGAALIGLLVKALFPKKPKTPRVDPFQEGISIIGMLQEKYTVAFYAETFDIPTERVDDFIYFAAERNVTPGMLHPDNEIELLETLFELSDVYKSRVTDE
ncbi:MAG: hypothetical protein R3359_09005 [Marinirhabdus sp.]|nr:hypothetical protein [Marinirhabdus sp.]